MGPGVVEYEYLRGRPEKANLTTKTAHLKKTVLLRLFSRDFSS